MELRHYVSLLWKWLWLIVLSTAIAAFFSWLAIKDRPDVYETSTTLTIGQIIESTTPDYADFYTSERLGQTYSELIKREPILKKTAAALGFENPEEEWPSLRSQIAVELIPGTQLMEIRVIASDPQRAKLIADEVARQLIAAVDEPRTEDANRAFMERQAASFPAKIEAAQAEIAQLEAELQDEFSASRIQDIQSQISMLQNQINNWQATFAQYQLLLGERGVNVLRVIEEAAVPTTPIGSSGWTQVALAAAIGMMLAVGAILLIEYLDDTLKSPEDVIKTTGLTTLGAIARIAGDNPPDKLVTVRYPKSPISEAYRVMRTNLQFSTLDEPLTTLLVTSPNPMEGKSTTLANLGVVMAQSGKSVLLVDSDLRRPMLHKIFQVSNREGLTSILLQDELVLDGRLQETGIENLRVLTSGPLPPNPSELLGSQKMRGLIEKLTQEVDVVVFDTPPALPVTDAAVLATQTDGVLVVADSGKTRRGAVRQAMENLQKVGANILGFGINRLTPRGSGGQYYYYQYYYADDGKGRKRRQERWYKRVPLVGRLFAS